MGSVETLAPLQSAWPLTAVLPQTLEMLALTLLSMAEPGPTIWLFSTCVLFMVMMSIMFPAATLCAVASQATPAQQKASWLFIQWATSEAIAKPYVEAGGVSGRMAVYNDPAIQAKYKYVKPMVESWQKGVPEYRPRFPAWSSITEIVAEFGSKMMLGEAPIDQGAKEIGTRMETVLGKEGYYDGKKKKLQ